MERDRQMIKILEAVEIRNSFGRVLACDEPSVHFEGHSQKREYDAFWVTFRLHASELEGVGSLLFAEYTVYLLNIFSVDPQVV